jgi:hypothetical protein
MRIRKRNIGAPKTTSKAAMFAKNVMKNCFIEAKEAKRKETSDYLREEEGKDNGFAPETGWMDKS